MDAIKPPNANPRTFGSIVLYYPHTIYLYHMAYTQTQEKPDLKQTELRRLQSIHKGTSFMLVLPKDLVAQIKAAKGDYFKCSVTDDKIVAQKVKV